VQVKYECCADHVQVKYEFEGHDAGGAALWVAPQSAEGPLPGSRPRAFRTPASPRVAAASGT